MKKKTTCSALEWNTMLGLSERLKADGLYRDYLLILVGCHFGLRIGDLLELRWRDFHNAKEIIINEGKTKKRRIISIHPRVQEAVNFCRSKQQVSQDEPIFSNRNNEPLTISYVNKRLKWIFARYRIKTQNASSHTLRKTFGLRCFQLNGESDKALVFLSEVFGHSSTAITRRYLGITQKQISDLYLGL